MSPASGDTATLKKVYSYPLSFHSINVPSEWGQNYLLPSSMITRFHSINVPSEWGPAATAAATAAAPDVSIQLMSPASGDFIVLFVYGVTPVG